jgi:hypothetical protein
MHLYAPSYSQKSWKKVRSVMRIWASDIKQSNNNEKD